MRSMRRLTAAAFAVVTVGLAAPAEAAPAQAAPAYPKADGRCVDQTGTLGQDLCAKVTAILLRDEQSTTDEIAVAVVPTTGDATIESWSTGLFNAWGVGKKQKNNGVLLVVALDDHKVRLETGRGVRDRLGDSDAGTIVDDVTARLADNEYTAGILTGLDDVRRQLGHPISADDELAPLAATAPAPDEPVLSDTDDSGVWADDPGFSSSNDFGPGDDDSVPLVPIVIGGFVVVALVGFAVTRGSSGSGGAGSASLAHHDPARQTTWAAGSTDSSSSSSSFPSSDSSGSSGSSFGGGSSDGGGATGSW